jgi:hypothetical protein
LQQPGGKAACAGLSAIVVEVASKSPRSAAPAMKGMRPVPRGRDGGLQLALELVAPRRPLPRLRAVAQACAISTASL